MRTACFSDSEGVLCRGTPLDRDPWTEIPLGQTPPSTETTLEGTWDQEQSPPEGTLDQAARHHTETPCGQTNTSENITLPQTSFAGGYKYL